MKPVLAESATPERAEKLLRDDEWIAQQKVDGQRVLVVVKDGNVQFLNRQGAAKQTNITRTMQSEFARFHIGDWCFDGEILDGTFWLFDLPVAGTHVDPTSPLAWRMSVLDGLVEQGVWADSDCVQILPRAETTEEKVALRDKVREFGGEGLMLKNLNGRYEVGRRSRHLLKYKFVHTADCVVEETGMDGKENLRLAVYRDGKKVDVGDCTARAGDGLAIKVGDVVEVKYLYLGANGRLYQPTYPKIRDDKSPEECTWDQLVPVRKGVLA